jgi:uncharacterized protein YecE (DUF72 family)
VSFVPRTPERSDLAENGRHSQRGTVRVGVSGWSYRHWRGNFYPVGLPIRSELDFALERFASIEVNRTFYSLLTPASYRRWYEHAPAGFEYAIKGSRFITHNKKISGVDDALANFLASGPLALGDKLGPVLWQLGPGMAFDGDRLNKFLALLPTDFKAAALIAENHNLPGRETLTSFDVNLPIRHVLEVRHPSWFTDETADIARSHGVALAFSHSSRWPYIEEITAPFVYLRLHGPRELYASEYGAAELSAFADRIDSWSRGFEPDDAVRISGPAAPSAVRDVYVFFDNDENGFAPRQAKELERLVAMRGGS